MKFQLALPVLLLFVLWKQWRFALGFLAGALGVVLLSLATAGSTGLASYLQSILGMASTTALDAVAAKARYGMFPTDMPNLHGLTYAVARGAPWGHVLNLLLSCLVLAWAARQRPSLLVALPAAMLVSYHMQPHDLTLLLLPLAFAVNDLLVRRRSTPPAPTPTPTPFQTPSPTPSQTRPSPSPGRSRLDLAFLAAALLLVFPLAAIVMVKGIGYLLSIAVAIVMVTVAAVPFTRLADPRQPASSPLPPICDGSEHPSPGRT